MKPSPLLRLLLERIGAAGPITAADFIEQALYHPAHGYYSSEQQRSGRAGDFFTSVDLGPAFGELLAIQFAEMWARMDRPDPVDLVEAAAGNARLARDLLESASIRYPDFYRAIRLHLVERGPRAREIHTEVLGRHAARLASSAAALPESITGIVYANELLDALPPHLVVMRPEGLREIYVDVAAGRRDSPEAGGLTTVEGEPSTPLLADYLQRVGARLEAGWHAEINLAAADWVREAGRRIERGYLVLVDYGHLAALLYSASHAAGTLTTFRRHASEGRRDSAGWLAEPGERDITSDVDLTGVALAAGEAGLHHEGTADQTYFLLALGVSERLFEDGGATPDDIRRRLALKTLLLPGGLGSTHKVMVFSKSLTPGRLRGLSMARLT